MSETKEIKKLGKIGFVTFGRIPDYNGYMGLSIGLESDHSSVVHSKLFHLGAIIWRKEYDHAIATIKEIDELLEEAKVNTIDELVGIPVEITYTQGWTLTLKGFRILTEVL